MDVLEAIRTRRTVGKIRPEVPPRALIEELLEAATWAPNHHLNEPWRFFVLAGEARERFGDVLAQDACRGLDPTSEQARAMADAQRKKAVRSPVIVTVASEPANGPKIVEIENVCAVACAIQNLLLAAHARGLAAKWSTGAPTESEQVKRFFDLPPDHQILGFIYLGYPDPSEVRPAVTRNGHETKVSWLGWREPQTEGP
jgi:nitroreductase